MVWLNGLRFGEMNDTACGVGEMKCTEHIHNVADLDWHATAERGGWIRCFVKQYHLVANAAQCSLEAPREAISPENNCLNLLLVLHYNVIRMSALSCRQIRRQARTWNFSRTLANTRLQYQSKVCTHVLIQGLFFTSKL
jgi:hypothetical protein